MTGHLEPLTAILRVGGPYGAKYNFAVMVRYLNPYEVEILGLNGRSPKPSEFRSIMKILFTHGVRKMQFLRQDGRKRFWFLKES